MSESKVGPNRPLFVLFGSSIVQLSYFFDGWGAYLTGRYARKADISLRGYGGWTSRNALQILSKVFPPNDKIQPSLVILYFGGNDSTDPDFPNSPNVPIDEYVENMRKIILHIKGLSKNTRVIMLTAPAVNEEQIIKYYGSNLGRTNERGRIYSEAGIKLAQELGLKYIDFWSALQEPSDWLDTVFWDGMHLTKRGSEIVSEKITKVIKEANWEPTLDWEEMPDEFDGIQPHDFYYEKVMEGINRITGISDSCQVKLE
ncbi:GDSL esterase/lipase WDL1-like [Solanum lycopersicum]|uniref:GDSL esterase/lipase WDL1-like n=1 Tax=Solanum lycopersicum TaxID=4081 RepID=UPI000276A715|nr:GDSL esterase/lipase CPRD49-like [Solanum lycopersicum]